MNRRFLVCAYCFADTGLLLPVLKDAECGADLALRRDGYRTASFDKSRHVGLVILGDSQRHSDNALFYGTEMSWVGQALEARKAVLGICHGAQLLAHVCGARLRYGTRLADKGLTPLAVTKAGRKDPLMRKITPQMQVAQWHYDTFELPGNAIELARSTNSKQPHCEAFRIGRSVYGLQFHPEPTPRMLLKDRWICRKISEETLAPVEEVGRAVLRAWLEIAVSQNR